MAILTTRNELLTASGLDWLHIVDVSDTTDSPQGTSKKIKLDNLFLNYLGFDSRYYTKTEINNFYSGVTNIAGYNKNDWDDAFGWGDHSTAGYLETVQSGQGITADNTDPINPIVNLGGIVDGNVLIDLKAQGLGASFSIEDVDEESSKISFDQYGIFLNHSSLISIYSHQVNGAVDIKGADVSLQAGAAGSMNFLTPDVVNTSSANGRVLTLMDSNTGEVEFQDFPDFQLVSEKGAANGYAPLNGSGIIDTSYLPSYVDDVLEYVDFASFPVTGEAGKIYIDLSENDLYRWSGSTYVEVSGTAPTTWGSITGTLTNQTDLQTALNGKVDVSGDTMTGTLIVPQLEMNQSANYFQPTTNDDKILFIGGNGSGVRDWSNIFFYTGGVFRMNGEDIVTMSQNTGRVNQGDITFNGDVNVNGASQAHVIVTNGFVNAKQSGQSYRALLGTSGISNNFLVGGSTTDSNNTLDTYLRIRPMSLGSLQFTENGNNWDIWHTGLGELTISNNSSAAKLILNGDTSNDDDDGREDCQIDFLNDGGTNGYRIGVENGAGLSNMVWHHIASGTPTETARLDRFGNFTANDFIQSSDERLKSNIKPLENKPIKADWKSFEMKDRKRVGVIAQELEQNHPEFVHTNEKGYKSVSYIDLLVAKIHELENRIKQLEG